jgi:hypothetical protein
MPPKSYRAHFRHAQYYLDLALNSLDSWEAIDSELSNIRAAQEWVNWKSNDNYLIKAYGELGWLLLDKTIERIAKLQLDYSEAVAKAAAEQTQSRRAGNEQVVLKAIQKLNVDFTQKLNDIVTSQKEIQTNLQPTILASGSSSVAAFNIINSTVHTGDVVHRRKRSGPKRAGKLQGKLK